MASPPAALALQIKQWSALIVDEQLEAHRRPSPMGLDETVVLAGATYRLHGVVYQFGETQHGGHYVAVARHSFSAEPFLAYNDSVRQTFARSKLQCDITGMPGTYQSQDFHAAGLLYERVNQ